MAKKQGDKNMIEKAVDAIDHIIHPDHSEEKEEKTDLIVSEKKESKVKNEPSVMGDHKKFDKFKK